MNPKTYNLVWKLWKEIGENSKFINTFIWGDITEPDKYDSIQWPALIVTPISSEVFENTINHTFKVSVADLVNEDESNRNEVWSDSQKALTDIIKLLRYEDFSYQLVNNPVMNVFYEKWNDNVSGWVTDIIVEFDFDNSECNLSIDNFLTPGPTYEGAVDVGPQMYLDDLLDVVITGATNGQGLVYQDGLWINGTVSSSGGTSFNCDDLLKCEVFAELVSDVESLSASLEGYLPLTGGTMSGWVNMEGTNRISFGPDESRYIKFDDGDEVIGLFSDRNSIVISNYDNPKIYGSPIDYLEDYSDSYSSLSLVNKGWVTSNFLTASSLEGYLPLTGGTMNNGAQIIFDIVDIQSGGVNDYTKGWYYGGATYASMGYNSTSDISVFDKQVIVRATDGSDESGVLVSNFTANKNIRLYSVSGANSASLNVDATSSAVYTNSSLNPINYASDYSANYTDRSLTDKEYVDNVIGAFVNIRSVARQTTDGTTLTGTTAETKQTAFLIPANTFVAGDVIELKYLARKVGTAGSGSIFFYVNTSDTLLGATNVARTITSANTQLFIKARRDLVIKSSTVTEYLPGTTNTVNDYNTFTVNATQTNINWAIDQYIIPSCKLGSTADSITLSMVNIIKS
jgi:hypothetical protein